MIILGASGNIAKHVIDILVMKDDIELTLFVRNKRKLRKNKIGNSQIVEGDVLSSINLKKPLRNRRLYMRTLRASLKPIKSK